MKAWLHMRDTRNGFRVWEFGDSGLLIHRTRYRNWYKISFADYKVSVYRILVGLCSDLQTDVTRKLRCISIEFEDGGEYIFPERTKK